MSSQCNISHYEPKHAIVRDLRDYIFRSQERARAFRFAISSARAKENSGQKEMNTEGVYDLDDYLRYCDDLLRWAPDVSSPGDTLLHLWEKPTHGKWRSFNEFFPRRWADINVGHPIAVEGDDTVIVHSADSTFGGSWNINDGFVNIKDHAPVAKGVKWPVEALLQRCGPDFNNGSLMHAFLSPYDYHRLHAPVSGKIVDIKNIQDQVYFQVTRKRESDRLVPDRGLTRDPEEVSRRQDKRKTGLRELDSPDDAGYQWCQTRGPIIIDTVVYGKVVVLPI